jgi:hypothetical protein
MPIIVSGSIFLVGSMLWLKIDSRNSIMNSEVAAR